MPGPSDMSAIETLVFAALRRVPTARVTVPCRLVPACELHPTYPPPLTARAMGAVYEPAFATPEAQRLAGSIVRAGHQSFFSALNRATQVAHVAFLWSVTSTHRSPSAQ